MESPQGWVAFGQDPTRIPGCSFRIEGGIRPRNRKSQSKWTQFRFARIGASRLEHFGPTSDDRRISRENCRSGWLILTVHYLLGQARDGWLHVFRVFNYTVRFCPKVAIRWLLQKPNVPSVVIGAKTLSQLQDNLGAVSFELSSQEMKILDEVSAIPAPYPYEMIQRLNAKRVR